MSEFNLSDLGAEWNKETAINNFFDDGPESSDPSIEEKEVVKTIQEGEEGEEDEEAEETSVEKGKQKKEEELMDWDDDPVLEKKDKDIKQKSTDVSTSPVLSAAKLLLEKGIVDFEIEDGEELDEDTALELLEEGFENGVESRIKNLLETLPTELQALNKYVINGGDMNEFISKLSSSKNAGINKDLDISLEASQELVVKQMYKEEGMDEDFIETQLEVLKDSGKLADFAKKRFDKWKENDKKISTEAEESQKEFARVQREKARKYYSDLKSAVNKEFEGIKLSPKDKTSIPSFMTERNIKLENGATITPFNKALMEVLQNETTSIQLAKLLIDRKEDGTFDFSQIEKSTKTKVTRELKDNLRRNKETPKESGEMFTQSTKSLADYFN